MAHTSGAALAPPYSHRHAAAPPHDTASCSRTQTSGLANSGALAVFAGHLFPLFHRFQGGKGVATAAGVLLAVHPAVGGATLLTWLIVAFFFRYSSLAALVSAVFAPLWYGLLFGIDSIAAAILVMSALLVWRHRANIASLIAGRESRIGRRKT